MIEPGPGEREGPSCGLAVDEAAEACPYCGYEFPLRKAGVSAMAWVFVALMVLFALPFLARWLGWIG